MCSETGTTRVLRSNFAGDWISLSLILYSICSNLTYCNRNDWVMDEIEDDDFFCAYWIKSKERFSRFVSLIRYPITNHLNISLLINIPTSSFSLINRLHRCLLVSIGHRSFPRSRSSSKYFKDKGESRQSLCMMTRGSVDNILCELCHRSTLQSYI